MKANQKILCVFVSSFVVFGLLALLPVSAQTLIKRTTYKTDSVDFGAGGTVTIVGAPEGSISVEGWQKNEVEISADIELRAETEADLAELAKVTTYSLDTTPSHVSIVSVGTFNRDYMKKAAKKFSKKLLLAAVRIDYRIKVPAYCDLEINGGKGDFTLAGVEGSMQIKFLESNADLSLVGGDVSATFGTGAANVKITRRSWRGRAADVQLAKGNMTVSLPVNLSAAVEASILRDGKIENTYAALKPLPRGKFTDKSVSGKAGSGGVTLSFTVGDGTLKLQ
jgi:hypothetical protein